MPEQKPNNFNCMPPALTPPELLDKAIDASCTLIFEIMDFGWKLKFISFSSHKKMGNINENYE